MIIILITIHTTKDFLVLQEINRCTCECFNNFIRTTIFMRNCYDTLFEYTVYKYEFHLENNLT